MDFSSEGQSNKLGEGMALHIACEGRASSSYLTGCNRLCAFSRAQAVAVEHLDTVLVKIQCFQAKPLLKGRVGIEALFD